MEAAINIRLYELLKQEFKLSDIKAKEFAYSIKEVVNSELNEKTIEYKSSFKEDILNLELKLTKEIAATRVDLSNKINDQFKWFIGGFITIVVMIIGLFATIIFKK
jgi:hypothetical protein